MNTLDFAGTNCVFLGTNQNHTRFFRAGFGRGLSPFALTKPYTSLITCRCSRHSIVCAGCHFVLDLSLGSHTYSQTCQLIIFFSHLGKACLNLCSCLSCRSRTRCGLPVRCAPRYPSHRGARHIRALRSHAVSPAQAGPSLTAGHGGQLLVHGSGLASLKGQLPSGNGG